MSPHPTRTHPRGLLRRGGSEPFTKTAFPDSPPSSKFEHGIPKVAGSTGGFWGILFGSVVVFILIGVLLWRFLRKRRLDRLARSEGTGSTKSKFFPTVQRGHAWGKLENPEITVDDSTSKQQIYGQDAFEASNEGSLSSLSLNPDEKPVWSYEAQAQLPPSPHNNDNLSPLSPWNPHYRPKSAASRASIESAGLPAEAEDPFEDTEDKGYSHVGHHRAPSPGMPSPH